MADTEPNMGPSTEQPPLPPRIALFAPWQWLARMRPGRRSGLIAALLITGYIEAPVPLVYTLRQTDPTPIPLLLPILQATFAPLEWSYHRNDIVRRFYDSQWELLTLLFGPA
jgi:hypothetical protein